MNRVRGRTGNEATINRNEEIGNRKWEIGNEETRKRVIVRPARIIIPAELVLSSSPFLFYNPVYAAYAGPVSSSAGCWPTAKDG